MTKKKEKEEPIVFPGILAMDEKNVSSLEQKAKTIKQLLEDYKDWVFIFRQGARGNQEAYNRARDTRYLFEEKHWVPLEEAQKEIERQKEEFKHAYQEGIFTERKLQQQIQENIKAELKQKLHEFHDELLVLRQDERTEWKTMELVLKEFQKKFEELLK